MREQRRGQDLRSTAARLFNNASESNQGQTRMIEDNPNATYSLEARRRGVSFIKDLLSAASGGDSQEARARLAQHRQETRDVAGQNTVVGNAEGFSFAPPSTTCCATRSSAVLSRRYTICCRKRR
jgi:hypothetical protein